MDRGAPRKRSRIGSSSTRLIPAFSAKRSSLGVCSTAPRTAALWYAERIEEAAELGAEGQQHLRLGKALKGGGLVSTEVPDCGRPRKW